MEFIGKVVSTKMQKTALVQVEHLVPHPLYKKRIRRINKFKAHDELGVKVGDTVKIKSCRPVSKDKHFKIKEVLGNGPK
jgi:small subunit ribosomal protein S17